MVKGINEVLDIPKAVMLLGPRNAMGLMMAELIIQALYSDFPDHWHLRDCLKEPDWEDWLDFVSLNNQEKRS